MESYKLSTPYRHSLTSRFRDNRTFRAITTTSAVQPSNLDFFCAAALLALVQETPPQGTRSAMATLLTQVSQHSGEPVPDEHPDGFVWLSVAGDWLQEQLVCVYCGGKRAAGLDGCRIEKRYGMDNGLVRISTQVQCPATETQ